VGSDGNPVGVPGQRTPEDDSASTKLDSPAYVQAPPQIGVIAGIGSRPINLREQARTILALTFAVALLGTLGVSFYGAISAHWGSVKDWLQLVLPAETGLLGSALGFYFGTTRADQQK
jgi:hypothetical protein